MKLNNKIRNVTGVLLITGLMAMSSCTKDLCPAYAASKGQIGSVKNIGKFSKTSGSIPSPHTERYLQKYDTRAMR